MVRIVENESMPVRFSARTGWNLAETETTRALRERRSAGLPVLDLTASNPTRCGIEYDAEAIVRNLAREEALDYDPDPRGMRSARDAVCSYYADLAADVTPEQVILTTSTSEAYSFLFRLLCDPGDEVLIAQPSYPLFDFLAQVDDVRLTPYPLFYDHGWHIDTAGLRARITGRTRAIALVHPNNPTGHYTRPAERDALERLCVEHGLALIVDEVFLDYPLDGPAAPSFAAGEHRALTFVLSGLSKIAGLPQMKAAWIVAAGEGAEVRDALERLEVIADTFLSMNAPIQLALPHWLADRRTIQRRIRDRVQTNLRWLDWELAGHPLITRLEAEAGWYAVLRVPALEPDEELAVRLIRERGVVLHPGYFFGFPNAGWPVVSLLAPEAAFQQGVTAILSHFSGLEAGI
jgi:alanine-synthesizing transaminase